MPGDDDDGTGGNDAGGAGDSTSGTGDGGGGDKPPGSQVGDPCEVSEDQSSVCLAPDLVCAEGGVRCTPGQGGGCACEFLELVTCADGYCCAGQYGWCVELAEHCGEAGECSATFFMDDADYPPAYVCGPGFGLDCGLGDFCEGVAEELECVCINAGCNMPCAGWSASGGSAGGPGRPGVVNRY